MRGYRGQDDQSWQGTAEQWFNRPVRITDAAGGVTGLDRPGYRINPLAATGDTIGTMTMDEIYAAYDAEIAEMWKSPR
jgi:hypothetical protein